MGMAQKDVSRKNNSLPPYLFSPCSLVAPQLQLCERVEQASRVLCSSPTRPPSASANNTFLDQHNCSVHTQPHPTIAKYLTASSLPFFPTSASDPPAARLAFSGTAGLGLSYLPNGIIVGD